MIQPKKIISGGQTGVDRGSLIAALKLEFSIGGWCPPNREAEDGLIPIHFPLNETPEERSKNAPNIPRSLRTEWNVRDADATLILTTNEIEDLGTDWTKECCIKMNKPFIICNPFDSNSKETIDEWLSQIRPKTLNLAGPSEKTLPGIQEVTKTLILNIFIKKEI